MTIQDHSTYSTQRPTYSRRFGFLKRQPGLPSASWPFVHLREDRVQKENGLMDILFFKGQRAPGYSLPNPFRGGEWDPFKENVVLMEGGVEEFILNRHSIQEIFNGPFSLPEEKILQVIGR